MMARFAWFPCTRMSAVGTLMKARDEFCGPCVVQEMGYGLVERVVKAYERKWVVTGVMSGDYVHGVGGIGLMGI